MIGDRLTENLDKLLNSNKYNTDKKENGKMAKLNAGDKKKDETTIEETVKEETVTKDDKDMETKKKLEEAAGSVADILKSAQTTANKAKEKTEGTGVLNKTADFVAGGEEGETKDEANMTEAEKEDARQKKISKERRIQRTIEHNQFIESSIADIKSTLGEDVISQEHEALQIACREYGRHQGFLMAEGERTNLRISRTFPKVKANEGATPMYTFKKTADDKIIDDILSNNLAPGKYKGDFVEYETSLKYVQSAPKTQFGSIVSIPEVLNVNLLSLNKGDFDVPTKEEIKASSEMVFALGTEAFFTFLMLYFRGEIRENDAVLETEAKKTSDQNILVGSVSAVLVEDKIKRKSSRVLRKRISSKSRPSIYIPENIIPYKIYETENITSLDADTRASYEMALSRALSAGNEIEAKYNYLDKASAKVLKAEMAEDNKGVASIEVGLFTGAVIPGIADGADFDLKHWSKHVRQPSGKFEKVSAPAVLTKMYDSTSDASKSAGKRTFKPVVKVLGMDLNLKELAAAGYPAAGRIAELGIKESDISNLMENHKLEAKQKREAAALANPNRSGTAGSLSRRASELAKRDAANLFFQTLMGDKKVEGFEIDADGVIESLMTVSLRA